MKAVFLIILLLSLPLGAAYTGFSDASIGYSLDKQALSYQTTDTSKQLTITVDELVLSTLIRVVVFLNLSHAALWRHASRAMTSGAIA